MKAAVDTAYTVSTTDGNIDYTLKADEVKENDGQIQMEIPLMFSLITRKGFFFNIGPKFMLPLYTPYNQHIDNPQINAYFPEEGVTVENARITGEVRSQGAAKIGQSTVIIGNIYATSAVIAGAVKGDIDVHGPVVLDTTAIVMGNIKSQSVQINNGAVVEGMCSQSYAEVNPQAFFDGLDD
jgi:hypothetical protein